MAIEFSLDRMLEKLREERDELRVRMHLASLELRQEWERAEKEWGRFESQAEAAVREATTAATEAAGRLGEELRQAYQRIREQLPTAEGSAAEGSEERNLEKRMKVAIRYRDAEGNAFEDHLETALNQAFLIDEEGWEEAPNESTFLTALRRFYEACGCSHVEIRTGG